MDLQLKKAIINSSGMEGFFAEDINFMGMNVNRERKDLLHAVRKFAQKIQSKCKDTDVVKLINEIKTEQISLETVTNFEKVQNKKRLGKMTVKVNRGKLDDIAESAMFVCENCERNTKKCKLRTALKECDIEPYNDSDIYCEYKQI